jgi:hypothetical protein
LPILIKGYVTGKQLFAGIGKGIFLASCQGTVCAVHYCDIFLSVVQPGPS